MRTKSIDVGNGASLVVREGTVASPAVAQMFVTVVRPLEDGESPGDADVVRVIYMLDGVVTNQEETTWEEFCSMGKG